MPLFPHTDIDLCDLRKLLSEREDLVTVERFVHIHRSSIACGKSLTQIAHWYIQQGNKFIDTDSMIAHWTQSKAKNSLTQITHWYIHIEQGNKTEKALHKLLTML